MGKRCEDCGSEECGKALVIPLRGSGWYDECLCLSRRLGQRDMLITEIKRDNERKEEIIKQRDERIAELEDLLQEARWAAMGDDL